MTRIPKTKTVVSYAYSVYADTIVVGNLQGFNPSQNRALDRVRQLMDDDSDIVEIVPGRGEITLSIDRFELYDTPMLAALGYDADISKITDPIQIRETITDPSTGKTRVVIYRDCWILNQSKTIREGTATVTETATIWPTKIIWSN